MQIGPGTVVAAGAVINPGSRMGENVIINTCASADHERIFGYGTHISPGVHFAGRVTAGRVGGVGIGATVIDRGSMGRGAVIRAAALLVKEIRDGVVVYGVPTSIIRQDSQNG